MENNQNIIFTLEIFFPLGGGQDQSDGIRTRARTRAREQSFHESDPFMQFVYRSVTEMASSFMAARHMAGNPPASSAAMEELNFLPFLSKKRVDKHIMCQICQEDFKLGPQNIYDPSLEVCQEIFATDTSQNHPLPTFISSPHHPTGLFTNEAVNESAPIENEAASIENESPLETSLEEGNTLESGSGPRVQLLGVRNGVPYYLLSRSLSDEPSLVPEREDPVMSDANGSCLVRMPCRHIFHNACIKKWLQTSGTCPCCRYEVEGYRFTL